MSSVMESDGGTPHKMDRLAIEKKPNHALSRRSVGVVANLRSKRGSKYLVSVSG